MHRSYQYCIYPNSAQTEKLVWMLDRCRELYNAGLEERREAYRMCGVSVTRYQQVTQLHAVKEGRPEYKEIGSQVLQDVLERLDKAFAAFFRRVAEIKRLKALGVTTDRKADYPRFKGRYRYNSLTWKQSGWSLKGGHLCIAGLGTLRVKWSRPIAGTIKTVTIKRDVDQWYATFSCVVERLAPVDVPDRPAVGIDMGIEYFASMSDGAHIENPRHYRRAETTIARRQRLMERRKKGGKNKSKAGVLVKKAHRKAARQRKDMQFKAARQIVGQYGAIAVEDLSIKNMTKRPQPVQNEDGSYAPNGAAAKGGLNKSIHDAAWGQFLSILQFKAEEAGVVVVKVNPAGTSQACSGCGANVPKGLDERWHSCPHCGLSVQRDVNAARNVLIRAGLARWVA